MGEKRKSVDKQTEQLQTQTVVQEKPEAEKEGGGAFFAGVAVDGISEMTGVKT